MGAMLTCPRKHYWRYERHLRSVVDAPALRFGSAWARAMEARWKGATAEEVFDYAFSGVQKLDELEAHTLIGMMNGYWDYYGDKDNMVQIAYPEIEFNRPMAAIRSFVDAGKIDGLCRLNDGRLALIEHKTTSDSVEPDSDYWTRLRFNPQILQYVAAARSLKWDVELVVYDVARKPSIRPKTIDVLDQYGVKMVLDRDGQRVFKKDGTPRTTGSEADGYTVQQRQETPEEFGGRLHADCKARPEFYFARREVPILDDLMEEFEQQRVAVGRMILGCRQQEMRLKSPEQAWPRAIGQACDYCEYSGFCLQNIKPDPANPPAGLAFSGQPNADTDGTTPTK
jgi:hypothetical protein